MLLKKDGILHKAEDNNVCTCFIVQVHTNGSVRIQRGNISERLNIQRLIPFNSLAAIDTYMCQIFILLRVRLYNFAGNQDQRL